MTKELEYEKIFEVVRLKQVIMETDMERQKIGSPRDAAKVATHFIGDEDREVLLVMCVNTKNQIVAVNRCHVGSIDVSIISPREIFKFAILSNAKSILICHNHPSLHLLESQEDIAASRRIKEAGLILGIELLDSIIVNANGDYNSLKDKGYI